MIFEIKLAVRSFKNRLLSVFVMVVTLGLTLGILATISQLSYTLLLKKLPYSHSEKLVTINNKLANNSMETDGKGASIVASAMLSQAINTGNLSSLTQASPIIAKRELIQLNPVKTLNESVRYVNSSYFELLSADNYELGQLPPNWDKGAAQIILSYSFWAQHYQHDKDILGKTVVINGLSMEVVAVTTATFSELEIYDNNTAIWLPWRNNPYNHKQQNNWFVTKSEVTTLARLADHANVEQVTKQADHVLNVFYQQHIETTLAASNDDAMTAAEQANVRKSTYSAVVNLLRDRIAQKSAPMAKTLLISIAVMVGIACVNVTILLLIQNSQRTKHRNIYIALGANKAQLFRQYFIQILIILLFSLVVALLVNAWFIKLLPLIAGDYFPRLKELSIGFGTVSSYLLLSLGLSYLFANWAYKVFHGSEGHLFASTNIQKSSLTISNEGFQVLLMLQVMAVTIMITVATVVIVSAYRVINQPVGVETQSLVSASFKPAEFQLDKSERLILNERILLKVRAHPLVEAASLSYEPPMLPTMRSLFNQSDGRFIGSFPTNFVNNDYFSLAGLDVLAGNLTLNSSLGDDIQPIVLSLSTANKAYPHTSAIGQRMNRGANQRFQVVAVVEDELLPTYASVFSNQGFQVYLPYDAWSSHVLIKLRKAHNVIGIESKLATYIQADDQINFAWVSPVSSRFAQTFINDKYYALIALIIGGVSIALACLGAHAVMQYRVYAKHKEIAIRQALGTRTWDLYKMNFIDNSSALIAGIVAAMLLIILMTITQFENTHLLKQVAVTAIIVAPFIYVFFQTVALLPIVKLLKQNPMPALKVG
ncbi:ABC transporter permease [Pseudoalteromonas sp. H105]|uniref:ABC transporter permease n=1 Tax=Pseudoalteromonas sp. H105 TaxID=1348393 RepID=UPI000732210B|nr:ABC transporter permease [Pseudoalteromonas sp. H105]KTF10047.1 hypothetical protein ATS75_19495 [Pseudoalteromonas sp. H105]